MWNIEYEIETKVFLTQIKIIPNLKSSNAITLHKDKKVFIFCAMKTNGSKDVIVEIPNSKHKIYQNE